MCPVVARPSDRIGCPCRARHGAWCIDTFVAVHRRVGDRRKALACFMMPAKEVTALALTGPVRRFGCCHCLHREDIVLELPGASQTETCAWQPLPVRPSIGLGMNVAR